MTKLTQTKPEWQSRALLAFGLCALAASAFGSAVYAFQTATTAQTFYGVPTDAVTKTLLAITADAGVAFGASVTVWLAMLGRKWSQRQAIVAGIATAAAFVMGVSNLSGYGAFTRQQTAVEAIHSDPLYPVAVAHAAAAAEHADMPASYFISSREQDLIKAARAPATATREGGDIAKAIGMHLLILMFGFAYRLPGQVKRRRRSATAKRTTTKRRAPAKRKITKRATGRIVKGREVIDGGRASR